MDAVVRFATGYDLYDELRHHGVPATIALVITGCIHVGWLATFVVPTKVIHANIFGSNIHLTMGMLASIANWPRTYLIRDARERALRTEFGQRLQEIDLRQQEMARQQQETAQQQQHGMDRMQTELIRHMYAISDPGAPYRRLLTQEATRSDD